MSGENQKQETAFQSVSGNLLASPSPNSARILLTALIAYGHDLGCRVGDRPIPAWQEDPVLGVWVRLSGPRHGAAGGDQVWRQHEGA